MKPTRSSVDALLEWFFAVVLLGCALFALIYAAKIAHMRMQFDYEEGNILNAGLRITEGQTPYPAPDGWPVIINPYGPIPYLLTAVLVKWFGVIPLREQLGVYHRDDRFTAETLRAIRMNYHEGAAFECYDSGFAYLPNP